MRRLFFFLLSIFTFLSRSFLPVVTFRSRALKAAAIRSHLWFDLFDVRPWLSVEFCNIVPFESGKERRPTIYDFRTRFQWTTILQYLRRIFEEVSRTMLFALLSLFLLLSIDKEHI